MEIAYGDSILTVWETSKLFVKAAASSHSPTGSVWGLVPPRCGPTFLLRPDVLRAWSGARCGLTCTSLVAKGAEHLFLCFLAMCMAPLEQCLLSHSAHVWPGCPFAAELWRCSMCSRRKPSLGERPANASALLSPSFHFLVVSFETQTFLKNEIQLIYFCFVLSFVLWCCN